jgi:hypothetical protein
LGTVDPRVRRYVPPVKIVWQSGQVDGAEHLLDSGVCHMRYAGGPASIVVDFGRELHGGVQLTNGMTSEHGSAVARVRFGESIAEAMGEANQDHAIHNQIIMVPWYGYAEFGNTGFRYVRIDLLENGAPLDLTKLRAVFLYRDLPRVGAFKCNDERLNRIWETGADTVHLCMQDMLWDGIKRDRLVWIGDSHPETMVINSVFGHVDVVPKSLDYVRDITPLPGWMNGISSYSLWWLRIQACWYLHHGDRDYLEAQRPYLCGLLKQLFEQIGPDNKEKMGDHRFLDWPSSEDPEAIHAGLHALLLLALREGAGLCEVLGETPLQNQCKDAIARLVEYVPPRPKAKQANALCVLAGLYDANETNQVSLGKDPLQSISTFYGYYVLQARAQAGDYAGCLEVIRKFWGAMLDLGATTFWEDFNLDWTKDAVPIDQLVPEGRKSIHTDYGNYCYKGLRHSLCHGWASGPTAWLSEHVLGFRPMGPGCHKLLIRPHLADLEWAEGAFPTPYGAVTVSHKKKADGTVETYWDAPKDFDIVTDGV